MRDYRGYKIGNNVFTLIRIGGRLLSWTVNGRDVIYPFRETEDGKERGGIFYCLPFFGPSPKGMENIPQHGWMRHEKMKLESATVDDGTTILTFYGSNKKSKQYPWLLEYFIRYTLKKTGVRIYLDIQRVDERTDYAPVNVAGHPYMAISEEGVFPFGDGERAITFSDEAYFINTQPFVVNTPGAKIQMSSQGCQKICLWSHDPSQSACIEPVLALPEEFGTDRGFYLAPGEAVSMSMELTIMPE